MGKAALLYVGAAIMMMTGLYGAITRTGVETTGVQADYESQVVAREIAQSAFNMMLSRVRADYAGHRPDRRSVEYRDGDFSYRAIGTSSGPVYLEAVGDALDARHRVTGMLEMFQESPLAALTFDGPLGEVISRGTSWMVTGNDSDTPSGMLSGTPTRSHGVRSVLKKADVVAQEAMPDPQVTGIAGTGDFVNDLGQFSFGEIAEWVDHYSGGTYPKTVFNGDQRWTGNRNFGSPSAPEIVVVDGDLTVAGNVDGYGILLVKGALDVRQNGTPVWEGLFIVQSQGTQHKLQGNAQIFGAMAMVATTADGETGGEEDAGLEGGHFDVMVFDGSGKVVYQAHQFDDRFGVEDVNVLRNGCKKQGGLCWEDLVLDSGAGQVKVRELGSGSFVKLTGANFDELVAPGAINQLAVTGFDLCQLPASTPGQVRSNRDAAKTVQVLDASDDVLYEVSVYHHLTGSTCAPETNPGDYFVAVEPMSFLIAGNARINMSSIALQRLYPMFSQLQASEERYILRDVREQSETVDGPLFEEYNAGDNSQEMREFFY